MKDFELLSGMIHRLNQEASPKHLLTLSVNAQYNVDDQVHRVEVTVNGKDSHYTFVDRATGLTDLQTAINNAAANVLFTLCKYGVGRLLFDE